MRLSFIEMGVCSHRHKEIKFDPRSCVPKKNESAVMTATVARDRCDNISKKWGFARTDTKKSNSATKKSNSTELSCKKRTFGPFTELSCKKERSIRSI